MTIKGRCRCSAATMKNAGRKGLCLIWTQPRAKGDCRVEGESGSSHIFGLFKELHSTLLALMEIRAPSPGQPNGLEGPGTGQVWKAPVRPLRLPTFLREYDKLARQLRCAADVTCRHLLIRLWNHQRDCDRFFSEARSLTGNDNVEVCPFGLLKDVVTTLPAELACLGVTVFMRVARTVDRVPRKTSLCIGRLC